MSISREVGDRAGEATTLNNIASVYYALGELSRALEYFEQALPVSREVGDRANEGVTSCNMGWIYLDEGDLAQAQAHFEQALAIAKAAEYPEVIEAAHKGLEEARRKATRGDESPNDESSG